MKKTLMIGVLLSSMVLVGQERPNYSNPVKIEQISSQLEESMPLSSANNEHLFFVRTMNKRGLFDKELGQQIWGAKKVNNSWESPEDSFEELNDLGNNAIVGISEDGNRRYIFNSIQTNRKLSKGLAMIEKDSNSQWVNLMQVDVPELTIGEGVYSFYVSRNERYIVFSQPIADNKIYKEDVFISYKQTDEKWSTPINLGEMINTSDNEISPFIAEDGQTLFFSSNGHNGLGGYDLFVSYRNGEKWTDWSTPINLGAPLNSAGFDAYLTINESGQAYFVSNRGQNNSDIYSTELTIGHTTKEEIKEDSLAADIVVVKELKEEKTTLVKSETKKESNTIDVVLKEDKIVTHEKLIVLFDLNRNELSNNAKEIISQQLPEIKKSNSISINGHTDTTGSDAINKQLSLARANAVKAFLNSKGVDESLMKVSGLGDKFPVATNETREGRILNRRVGISF